MVLITMLGHAVRLILHCHNAHTITIQAVMHIMIKLVLYVTQIFKVSLPFLVRLMIRHLYNVSVYVLILQEQHVLMVL